MPGDDVNLALLPHDACGSDVGLGCVDRDLRFVEADKALCALPGRTVDELLGRPLAEVWPAFARVAEPLLYSVIESGQPLLEVELASASAPGDAQCFWLASFYPVRSRNGTVLGVELALCELATNPDESDYAAGLDDHVKARYASLYEAFLDQQRSVETRALLDTLINSAPIGMAFLNQELQVMRVNEHLALLNGWPVAAQIGCYAPGLFGALGSTCEEIWQNVLAGGEPVVDRELHGVVGGALRDVVISSYPVRAPGGDTLGLGLIVRDRSLQKQSERRLAFLLEASVSLAASLDEGHIIADLVRIVVPTLADMAIVHLLDEGKPRRFAVNHSDPARKEVVQQLMERYSSNLWESSLFYDVVQHNKAIVLPAITDATLIEHAQDDEHLRLMRAVGTHVSMIMVPLVTRERLIGVLSLGRIDTPLPYGESELALAQELANRAAVVIENAYLYRLAQSALHERDMFISVAAHDLRTPLTVILGQAQLMARRVAQGDFDERSQRTMRIIIEQGQRLNQMIGTLLDLARIKEGRLAINLAPLDLVGLLERLIAILQPTLSQHTLMLTHDDGPLLVEGDALRLEQVFQNLLGNAVKYSPEGGPVEVRIERRGTSVAVAVSDSGIGIPVVQQPRLFEPFFRAANAAQSPGLGIGLHIVHEIVHLHGGSISVRSVEGEGSTFTVLLPLKERSAASA